MVISQKDGKWESVRLGDYSQVFRGGSPRPIQNYLTNSSQGINWIKIGDTRKDEKYITNTVEKIIAEGVSKSREVFAGDLLLSNSMSFGRPYILKINGCIHDGWLVIQDYQNSFDTQYLYYSLLTDSVKMQFNNLAAGSGVHNLNKEIVSNIILNKPNKGEQVSIATILSEIDKLIYNLEKLIEKKKNIKQGAMQELLIGKRRLPGFDEEWITINFIKKSKVKARIGWQGLKKSEYLDSGYAYLVTGTDFYNGAISWNTCHFVEKERYDIDRNIQIKNNDLLITKDGSLGKTALVTGLEYPATLNSGIFVVRPLNKSYVPAFVYYILSSFVFREYLERLSAGSTIVHLYQKDLDKFEFMIPPTEKEQVAIAEVLSDMDKEIEELEKKLTKYRNLKQGMMSELLTGHIRLTEKEDA